MEELFSGYRAVTPQFKVLETDKTGRPRLQIPTDKTAKEKEDGGAGESKTPGVKTEYGRRKRHAEDPRKERTVFVGNLPPTITRRRLKQLFSQHGKVESVRLRSIVVEKGRLPVRVAKRKQEQISSSTINSYVVYTEEESARKALELNGASVGDRHIRVDVATGGREHIHERSVFVGGLPYGVDDEEFRTAFEKYGDVESVRVVREQKTGIGKGFGFVTYRDRSGVMFALQSSRKTELNGQKLRVMKSKDTTSRTHRAAGSVAQFSGTQVKTAAEAVKTVTRKRAGRRVGGERVKKSDPARKRFEQSKTEIRRRDGKDNGGENKTAKKVGVSEEGVRPSRTFHKKKEARKREKEERKKGAPGEIQKNYTKNRATSKKSDTNT